MRRISSKVAIIILSVTSLFVFFNLPKHPVSIDCFIEGTKQLPCLLHNEVVYFPFEFLKKQFDVNGKFVEGKGFEYYTSYSKSKRPDFNNYSVYGQFGNFAFYNVERRGRVKCISGQAEVPMSIQWDSIPYFYPIQIAQYGLQHYSRMEIDPQEILEFRSGFVLNPRSQISHTTEHNTSYIVLDKDCNNDEVTVNLNPDSNLGVLNFEWNPKSESSFFKVVVQGEDGGLLTISYVIGDDNRCLWQGENNNYFYDLGVTTKKMNITRNLNVDAVKAKTLGQKTVFKNEENTKTERFKLLRLTFYGCSSITLPIKQQAHAHSNMFIKAADWLVEHQNEEGAWTVPVKREILAKKLSLKAGWSSAMAQGHGLSVLVRAYHSTQDEVYLNAAIKALGPYQKMAKEGGVRNDLFGHPWFEEYPTTPPTFVLNGFIYSLIGLYDMSVVKGTSSSQLAQDLFTSGLESLRLFLPLYDTGSGSVYDLRHLSLKTPPNLARWDYHKVHVYLLRWMFILTKDKTFLDYSERWLGYSMGKKAKHN